MEIQWSLVLFTALTGMAGWTLACVAVDEFAGKTRQTNTVACVVAAALAAVGGIASVTHLSHPENMLAALSHPTSGIFTEAVLVGLAILCAAVYVILAVRQGSAGVRKAFAVLAAVFGVALSFMAGASYMMDSQLMWNTFALPLGYCGTAIPVGVALYLVIAAFCKEEDLGLYAKLLVISAVVAAVTAALYGCLSGTAAAEPAVVWGLCVVVGAVVPAVCGAVMVKKPELTLPLAVVALVGAFVGAVAYRCLMWMVSVVVNNFFGML